MTEILPTFERDAAHGVMAPAGTPRAVLNQISRDIARALEFPDVKDRMHAIGFEPSPLTPEEHDRLLRRLYDSLSKVVVTVGLRAPRRAGGLAPACERTGEVSIPDTPADPAPTRL